MNSLLLRRKFLMNRGKEIDPSLFIPKYLTFKALQKGTFSFSGNGLYYSLDGENWYPIEANTPTPIIRANKYIYFKGEIMPNSNGIGTFSSTGNFDVLGNVLSLRFGDNAENVTSLIINGVLGANDSYCFAGLFRNCNKLINARELLLSATLLTYYCYLEMFCNCISLISTPELPATQLECDCYYGMFSGCSSLTRTPNLTITDLAIGCCFSMFKNCTSLTSMVCSLSETTAPGSCYQCMFEGCTSLTNVVLSLPATTLGQMCYQNMFKGCTSLVSGPALPAETLAAYCYQDMFSNCTSLLTAPTLLATTLAKQCYKNMFNGCSSLSSAPALPAETLENACYSYMFSNCSSLTSGPELPALTLINNCYENMFSNCTHLNYIKAMFTTTPGNAYTYNWVYKVASNGTFIKNSEATWDLSGKTGIPDNWTVQTASST